MFQPLPQDNTRVRVRGTKSPSAPKKHNLCNPQEVCKDTPRGTGWGGRLQLPATMMSDLVFSLFTHLAKSLQSSLPRHWKFPLLGSWGSFPSVRVGSANGRSCSICDSAAVWGRAVCWDAPTQPKQAGNQEPRSSPVTMPADGAQTEHGS